MKKWFRKYNKTVTWFFQKTIIIGLFHLIISCTYSRGDIYRTTLTADSSNFVIMDKGPGSKLSVKAAQFKFKQELKGNRCQIFYITDSIEIADKKALIFINARVPDINNEILTRGYFGSFTVKQESICLLVSYEDMPRYLSRYK